MAHSPAKQTQIKWGWDGFQSPPHNRNEPAQLLWRPLESHVELSQESTKSKLSGQRKAGFPPIEPEHTRACGPGSKAAPGPAPGVAKGERKQKCHNLVSVLESQPMANEKVVANTFKKKRRTEKRKTRFKVILTLFYMNPEHQHHADGNIHCNYTLLAFY